MIIDGSSLGSHFARTALSSCQDLFEQYGVQVPTTMEEIEAARLLSRDGIYGITLRAKRSIHDLDMEWLFRSLWWTVL